MKFSQEDTEKIILIQANIRGYLVRQEIRRQLLEIYEYEKEQLEYLQGQQYGEGDYYNLNYDIHHDQQEEDQSGNYIRSSQREDQTRKGIVKQSLRKDNENQTKYHGESDENLEFHRSSNSSSVEIEKKVQEKYIQQQMFLKERKQAQEYQLHQIDTNKQKQTANQIDASRFNNGACLVTGKNEADCLKFPQVHPIFSNSQMKQLMNTRESQDQQDLLQENANQNKEKLNNIASKLKKEEEEFDSFSPENLKVKLYSQSANLIRHFDEIEDDSMDQQSQKFQYEEQSKENIGNNKQKFNEQQRHQEQYKENHHQLDYLNQKSVNISVEITESNLLAEKRLTLLPISNHNNQNNIQKNSVSKQSNNNNYNNQMKNPPTQNKINPNRFYQEEDQYYLNEQINLYQQNQRQHQEHQSAKVKQNGVGIKDDHKNTIQVIDQFNYSPQSGSSSSQNPKGTHFAKISNIEYRSYPGDNFLFEESQNYEAYQRHGADFYHHEHHPQQASFSEPQENNELIIDKSVFIKNMGVIKQMQDDQKKYDQKTTSLNHEKNMKKIRKMIHQNQVLNCKNRKYFLQLSNYSLESYQSMSKYEEEDKSLMTESQMEENMLETTQQQQHNNGQIFDTAQISNMNSMMSSRVHDSAQSRSKKQLSNNNKIKTHNNHSSTAGSANTNPLMGSLNKKPIMFDFDIYIIAATKIQKVFKGYLSRKFIVEYQKVKKATLIIEAQYLKFKQFLVKKMKDCTNQIECSSYNIIKLVQDFEKGEKFLKSQFRKKNFDQKIKVNRDKLCKVFIQFINGNPESKQEEGKKLTAEQENLHLQKEIIKLKQLIVSQQRGYKEDLESMEIKYEELRNLHKETIKKYINGIQNLSAKRKVSNNEEISYSNLQESSQQQSSPSSSQRAKQSKLDQNSQQKLLKYYKENDTDLNNKIKTQNQRNQLDNQNNNKYLTKQNEHKPEKRHGNSADCKRSSNKSHDRNQIQKQFESLKHEAERDLEDFESQIKKIKYEHGQQKSPSPSNKQRKHEIEHKTEKARNGNGRGSNHSLEKDKQKKQQIQKQPNVYNYNHSNNSSNQQYMSDEFINYSKFSINTSSKK